MKIDNLSIEITRRCNQQCDHCLRGKSQNINIDIDYVNTLFSKIDRINSLTITGGEPSIAPKSIHKIIDCAIMNDVEISDFYIATNGKRITMPFVDAIQRLYNFCTDNTISRVEISNDKFHELPTETRAFQELLELEFVGYRWENRDRINLFYVKNTFNRDNQWTYPYFNKGENGIIASGLAVENGLGTKEIRKEAFEIENKDITEGNIYLNCKGKVLAGCDFSFEDQDDKDSLFLICDVKDFSLEKVKQYMDN